MPQYVSRSNSVFLIYYETLYVSSAKLIILIHCLILLTLLHCRHQIKGFIYLDFIYLILKYLINLKIWSRQNTN